MTRRLMANGKVVKQPLCRLSKPKEAFCLLSARALARYLFKVRVILTNEIRLTRKGVDQIRIVPFQHRNQLMADLVPKVHGTDHYLNRSENLTFEESGRSESPHD